MTDTLSRTNETDSLEEKGINELNLLDLWCYVSIWRNVSFS